MNFSISKNNPTTLAATAMGSVHCSPFTGKEKDSESGYHYFGARYYDSEALTGWLSVDPMSDKYLGINPYNYCAWNPVKLVDPDGHRPIFVFRNDCKDVLLKIVRDGLGNNGNISLVKYKNGFTLNINNVQVNRLNDRQLAFYKSLMTCIKSEGKNGKEFDYQIDVYSGCANVTVGNYKNNAIDIADIDQFNAMGKGGVTKQSKFLHELHEQFMKKYNGNKKGEDEGYLFCHKSAMVEEDKVNGFRRDRGKDRTIARGVIEESFMNGNLIVTIQTTPTIKVTQTKSQ